MMQPAQHESTRVAYHGQGFRVVVGNTHGTPAERACIIISGHCQGLVTRLEHFISRV